MTVLPETVSQAWEEREGPVVLVTVDNAGMPNAIYATCVSKFSEDTLLIADNFFHKTRANILAGSLAALLFITKKDKAYQIKGHVEYVTEGPLFEDMQRWNPTRLPGHAVAAVRVEQVFAGAEQLA